MTRNVEELRRESERNRAELAATVDRLRQGIADTTQDLRHIVSPQHLKSEVTGYVSDKAQSWVEGLKQQAMDNPMRAVAAGTAVAVPLLRLARGVPLPLLMIAAGLALTSKTVRDRATEAASPVIDGAGEMIGQAVGSAQAAGNEVQERILTSRQRAAHAGGEFMDAANSAVEGLKAQASQAADTVADRINSGMDAVKGSIADAPAQTRQIIGDNAALIGGLGLAIGAIVAAALPETRMESRAVGPVSDSLKRAAGEAAGAGLDAAKEATVSAAGAAASGVRKANLGEHASRMTRTMADALKEATGDVVEAAFNPSPNSNI